MWLFTKCLVGRLSEAITRKFPENSRKDAIKRELKAVKSIVELCCWGTKSVAKIKQGIEIFTLIVTWSVLVFNCVMRTHNGHTLIYFSLCNPSALSKKENQEFLEISFQEVCNRAWQANVIQNLLAVSRWGCLCREKDIKETITLDVVQTLTIFIEFGPRERWYLLHYLSCYKLRQHTR